MGSDDSDRCIRGLKMPEESPEDCDAICPPELRSLVKCVFCGNDITEETDEIIGAHLLVCFHSVCKKCVEGWDNSDTKFCPECRVDIPKDLVDHKLLQEMVEQPYSESARKGVCGMHSDTQATRWCHQCNSLVCDGCIKLHDQLKGTMTHDIVDATNMLPSSDLSLVQFNCELHPSMKFEIFCKKCETMTCRNCQLEHHRQHNEYEFIAVHCKEYKNELLKIQNRMCQTEKTMETSQKAALFLQNDLRSKKENIRKSIFELHQRITQTLENRIKKLLKELDTVIDEDIRVIQDKMSATSQLLVPLKHCIQIVDLMVLQASDNTVIHSKKHLEKCFKLLLHRNVDLVNPDVKKSYSFCEGDHMKQLSDLLETVGILKVDIKNTGKPGMDDMAMYLPILEQLKLANKDIDKKTAEKPPNPPARIHLRQDLQSPEGFKSMERVSSDSRASTSTSPEVGGMPHWHTPQGPPIAKMNQPPAVKNQPLAAPKAGSPNLLLKDLLATNTVPSNTVPTANPTYAITQVPQQPNTPNQRMMPQEASVPAMNYLTDTRCPSTCTLCPPPWVNTPWSTIHQADPNVPGSRFIISEVPQKQMHSVAPPVQSMQHNAPPPYNYAVNQPPRTYSTPCGVTQRRQSDPPRPMLYQNLFRNNNVSITPSAPFQQQAQHTAQMIHQSTQQQQVQMQAQQMQQQQQLVQVQSFQLQGVQIQPLQHMQDMTYIPGSTHNPYPQ